MTVDRDIAIAVLEDHQKDCQFELRVIEWSFKEIAGGVRPKHEKAGLLVRKRGVEAALEKGKKELKELRGY